MPQNYNDITAGFRVTTQIPLDVKQFAISENALTNLGVDDNLAFTYIQGLTFYCATEGTRWEWREVQEGEEGLGLRPIDYTYPSDSPATFGIAYADKVFNFFPYLQEGPEGDAATITLGTVSTGVAGSNVIITNSGTSSAAVFNFTIPRGNAGTNGTNGTDGVDGIDASNNLQKVITSNYTILNADNNYTILINNGSTPINIIVPAGLSSNINVAFIQQGTGDVTFTTSSTVINSYTSMKKIKGQHLNAYLEQVGTSNVYQLFGALKS